MQHCSGDRWAASRAPSDLPDGSRYTRGVLRASLALAVVSLALVCPLGSGASIDRTGSPSGKRATAETPGTIALRARSGRGAWQKALSLRLVKDKLLTFAVCALWDQPPTAAFTPRCTAAAGAKLPSGTTLRLEQNPIRKAVRRADSPGWGLLGVSDHSELEAILSNTITGNVYGTLHYRVTLRSSSGEILATSNALTLYLHR